MRFVLLCSHSPSISSALSVALFSATVRLNWPKSQVAQPVDETRRKRIAQRMGIKIRVALSGFLLANAVLGKMLRAVRTGGAALPLDIEAIGFHGAAARGVGLFDILVWKSVCRPFVRKVSKMATMRHARE